jgi:hypothetical protein
MTRTRRSRRDYSGAPQEAWERLELIRDGLGLARRVLPGDEKAARREILRARRELQKALRALAPRREMAPLLAPLMSLILELGGLLSPRP